MTPRRFAGQAGSSTACGAHEAETIDEPERPEVLRRLLRALEGSTRCTAKSVDEPDHDPDAAAPDAAPQAHRAATVPRRTGRDREVLLGLLLEHVERVVDGDDAEQLAGLVDDGDGEQVVLAHVLGDVFLVVVGVGGEQVPLGDLGDERVGLGEQQVAQGDRRR